MPKGLDPAGAQEKAGGDESAGAKEGRRMTRRMKAAGPGPPEMGRSSGVGRAPFSLCPSPLPPRPGLPESTRQVCSFWPVPEECGPSWGHHSSTSVPHGVLVTVLPSPTRRHPRGRQETSWASGVPRAPGPDLSEVGLVWATRPIPCHPCHHQKTLTRWGN